MISLAKPDIGDDEIEAVIAVYRSGMLAAGPSVQAFEAAFAEAIGVEHAVAVSNGTAALFIGLLGLGLGPGDEVILPSFTFAATANSVRMVGATPVFVDIDGSDFTIHADAIAEAVTGRTRAIMPVHLYGQPAPMGEITALAKKKNLLVIEDAAQAHLAMSGDQMAGSIGDVATFSFYPTKNMTTGEGGMITTNDGAVAEWMRMFRNQGMVRRYEHQIIGLNERMTEVEGAVGLIQLSKLPAWTERRREIASVYRERLDPRLGVPIERDDAVHVYHQFTLAPEERQVVIDALNDAGVGHGIYYPLSTHRQVPYLGPTYRLPVTEEMEQRVVSIPVRHSLTDGEVGHIIETLNRAIQ